MAVYFSKGEKENMIKNVVIYGAGPYAEVFFYDLVQYGKNNFIPVAFTVSLYNKLCKR